MDAVYQLDGMVARPSAHAVGPWHPAMQHGAAPAALIALAAERLAAERPMRVVRLTIDLLRPVPIAPLAIETEIIREGRKIQLAAIRLLAEGVEVVRASVLKIRTAELALPEVVIAEPLDLPGPDDGNEPEDIAGIANPFLTGVSMRVVKGAIRRAGPAAVWFRAERPIIRDMPITPLMRAAIAADFCNGASTVLDFDAWTFINGDLTISLARLPEGEWILLDAATWLGRDGAGIAFARLGDSKGYFGRAVQSIVIEPR